MTLTRRTMRSRPSAPGEQFARRRSSAARTGRRPSRHSRPTLADHVARAPSSWQRSPWGDGTHAPTVRECWQRTAARCGPVVRGPSRPRRGARRRPVRAVPARRRDRARGDDLRRRPAAVRGRAHRSRPREFSLRDLAPGRRRHGRRRARALDVCGSTGRGRERARVAARRRSVRWRRAPTGSPSCAPALDGIDVGVSVALPSPASLLGRGPGLTPSGDDVLAGYALGRRALGADVPELTRPAPHDGTVRPRCCGTRRRASASPQVAALVAALATDSLAVAARGAAAGGAHVRRRPRPWSAVAPWSPPSRPQHEHRRTVEVRGPARTPTR